jgi:serine/threonine protein kinase
MSDNTHQLALAAGTHIDLFRIESVLGKGGFGITYLAVDTHLVKKVAIKELLPDSIATRVDGATVVPHSASEAENWEWAKEKFLEEARTLAGFSHPAIVGVQRLIEANGTVYMIMDFVEGESYEARLRRIGKEPDQDSLMAVIEPILDGVAEIHAKGLLHRDIKPDNILISHRGHPILIDFGAARSSIGATMTMTSIVTHGYSPIEQYQTKGRMGPWTDIYALGAVMCRAISGEKPPVAADRLMEDEFEWLSYQTLPGYSERFLQSVDWSLRVRPEDRPKSIQEWHATLELHAGASEFRARDQESEREKPIQDSAERDYERDEVSDTAQPIEKRTSKGWWIVALVAAIFVGGLIVAGEYAGQAKLKRKAEATHLEVKQRQAEAEATALRVEEEKRQANAAAEAARLAELVRQANAAAEATKLAVQEQQTNASAEAARLAEQKRQANAKAARVTGERIAETRIAIINLMKIMESDPAFKAIAAQRNQPGLSDEEKVEIESKASDAISHFYRQIAPLITKIAEENDIDLIFDSSGMSMGQIPVVLQGSVPDYTIDLQSLLFRGP